MFNTTRPSAPPAPALPAADVDKQYRLEALRLALGIAGCQSASTAVGAAEEFYQFLSGAKPTETPPAQ